MRDEGAKSKRRRDAGHWALANVTAAALAVASVPAFGAPVVGFDSGAVTILRYWQDGSAVAPAMAFAPILVELNGDASGDFALSGAVATRANTDLITVKYLSGNVDPVINFGVQFKDSGAPSIFTFEVIAPLEPTLTGLQNFRLDLVGSFADGSPANGGTIAPNADFGSIMNATVKKSDDSAFTAIAGTGAGASFKPFSDVYGAGGLYSLLGTYDCGAVGCTDFGIRLSVLGSGGGDVLGLNARFEIVPRDPITSGAPVPLPAAAWLLGSALACLLGAAQRRAPR